MTAHESSDVRLTIVEASLDYVFRILPSCLSSTRLLVGLKGSAVDLVLWQEHAVGINERRANSDGSASAADNLDHRKSVGAPSAPSYSNLEDARGMTRDQALYPVWMVYLRAVRGRLTRKGIAIIVEPEHQKAAAIVVQGDARLYDLSGVVGYCRV